MTGLAYGVVREELGAEERILYSVAKTRKAYVVEYACAVILLSLGLWPVQPLGVSGLMMSAQARVMLWSMGAAIIMYAEVSRVYVRYKFTNKKIIIISGILRQHRRSVYYHPLAFVPDINVEQNVMQRMFDYGTVSVKGSIENAFEIKDVDNPREIMAEVEQLIDKARVEAGGMRR